MAWLGKAASRTCFECSRVTACSLRGARFAVRSRCSVGAFVPVWLCSRGAQWVTGLPARASGGNLCHVMSVSHAVMPFHLGTSLSHVMSGRLFSAIVS